MMENIRKVYVNVLAEHLTDGRCRPDSVRFESGQKFTIDRTRFCCRAASTRSGGSGIRYTVVIQGREVFLYDEENGKWFIEVRESG